MKRFFTGSAFLFSLLVLSFHPQKAFALTFADSRLFSSGIEPFITVSYGASQSAGFSWNHDLHSILASGIISSAELSITYSRTHLDELWQIDGVGNLNSSFGETISVFPLSAVLLQDLQVDGILTLRVKELTAGADSFRLHRSVLSGQYEFPPQKNSAPSIPEPAMWIYFLGTTGVIFSSKRSASCAVRHVSDSVSARAQIQK